jgi:hypothetical protein
VSSKSGENKTGYESESMDPSKDLVEPQKIRSDQTAVFQWLKQRVSVKSERAATARKKKAGGAKGKQFVSNTPKAKVRSKK